MLRKSEMDAANRRASAASRRKPEMIFHTPECMSHTFSRHQNAQSPSPFPLYKVRRSTHVSHSAGGAQAL